MTEEDLVYRKIRPAEFDQKSKARVAKLRHTVEDEIANKSGGRFDYDSLEPIQAHVLNWLFNADFEVGLEHKGLGVDEVTELLSKEKLPQNFTLESLLIWIDELRDITEASDD